MTRTTVAEYCRGVWQGIAAKPATMRRIAKSALRHRFYRFTRSDNRSDPLEATCVIVVEMGAAGVPETEAIALEQAVRRTREAVYGATRAPRSLSELDLEEDQTDAVEDHATCHLHVLGETAARLDAGADADERAARVLEVRAGQRRQRARALRYQQAR